MPAPNRPANPNSNIFNYSAMMCAITAYLLCRMEEIGGVNAGLIIIGVYAGLILALEVIFLRTPWRDSVGLDFSRRNTSPKRIGTKLLGMYGSFGFVALMYWIFPEYHGNYYEPYWEALRIIGPVVLVLAVPYVVFMDERMKEPEDSYYHFGRCLLGDWHNVPRMIMVQHLLGWVVKAFFLPLMWVSIVGNINYLHNNDFGTYFDSYSRFFRLTVDILFTLDLLGAVVGYAFAIRLFDTHLRSTEPTLFGWMICLICYQPFQSVVMRFYLAYDNDNGWRSWLDSWPVLEGIWGTAALVLLLLYTLASINFGCRFSNLTHRGVLTRGMYGFSKHPAYVAKNLFWWMTYVPFVPAHGWSEALRYTLLLIGVSTVYYFRAKTEERHLSRDPDYVAYALYMNEHSIFRHVAVYLPFLRYKPPANWEKLKRPYMGIKQ